MSVTRQKGRGRLIGTMAALAMSVSVITPAQTLEEQTSRWRSANEDVGQMMRGHIDILKWEAAQPPESVTPSGVKNPLTLNTATDAVQAELARDLERANALAVMAANQRSALVEGRWMALDPIRLRRVDHWDELLDQAVHARKAWFDAYAAHTVARHLGQASKAADVGLELGLRMQQVGNWTALELAVVKIAAAEARAAHRAAELAALRSDLDLRRRLGVVAEHDGLQWPSQPTALPPSVVAWEAVSQQAQRYAERRPLGQRPAFEAQVRAAWETLAAAHAIAREAQSVVETRRQISEEMLLHYNGMLKSTWDLLNARRSESESAAALAVAERDFWLAEADLQWVLWGGEPESLVQPGLAGSAGGDAGGH